LQHNRPGRGVAGGGALDIEHLAEKIEDLGKRDRRAVESHMERLLLHLLKWRDDPAQALADAYRHARGDTAIDTGLPLTTFPEACPWTVAPVLAEDFLPEAP
jgi:hypothetical protein